MRKLADIWKANRVYFIPYLLLLLSGMAGVLVLEKGDAILWLNARHTAFLDGFFRFWTLMGEEWPFILAGIGFLFYRIRHTLYVLFLGVMVTILSFLLKQYFAHPRPAKFFEDRGVYEDLNKVDFIQVAQGFTSFPSGHTMAAFAIFTFLALNAKSSIWKIILLVSATLVGISRIYLLQHFLQDVCLGSICGIAIALIVHRVQLYYDSLKSSGIWNVPLQELVRPTKDP